jgi:hypothetical protein
LVIQTRSRKNRIKKKENVILTNAKQRSKERGWYFNLTIDDIKIPDICPVLGIPIYRDSNKLNENSPTLDRIDNTKGYVKGNVCVISHRANVIKSFGSLEEHIKVINYIKVGLLANCGASAESHIILSENLNPLPSSHTRNDELALK